ncbi:MAG: Gfo/Idh/MocA family oxidoreductase [Flavobacteriaceae bacterium]|nr:Gfo/Idh/MocA family oxidoreductase [Flavobacteriaceae bacterium]
MKNYNRRNFLKKSSLGVVGASTLSLSCQENMSKSSPGTYMGDFADKPIDNIKAAFIGLGARGPGHLKNFATLENTKVVALCDLYNDNVEREKNRLQSYNSNSNDVKLYWGDENKWKIMLKEVKPDIVFISTNWKNHAPMVIQSMKDGAHAFCEVPLAITTQEMWDIVNVSEKTQKHCMMMENVNYGREELMYLNMCRKGIIGQLLHAEAAYIHELRFQMFEETRGTGSWRTHHYANGKGNLYPTHGLGPVAQYMNIARRDDNFRSIVSYSTPSVGRQLYAAKNFDIDHKWNKLNYQNGDLNTSIIKTNQGRTILVQWDETSPRPYTRHNLILGSKGALAGFPTRIALEGGFDGISKDHHSWIKGNDLKSLYEKYDHPLYKRLNSKTKKSGHGGMDGIMMYRIVECLKNGLPLDQNVYEGCFWSAVTPLSAKSIDEDGMPQQFPDFTRGMWRTTSPLKIIS